MAEPSLLTWLSETNIQAAIIGPIVSMAISVAAYKIQQNNSIKVCLANLIQEIEDLATEHWCSPSSDTNNHFRANKILSKLKTLGWKINQDTDKKKNAMISYRQAVTDHDFDDPHRQFVLFDSPRIILISEKAKNLRKALGIKKHH
ncbi:MAG: hypothetical protein L6Q57_00375 [Alphaproteobacteria bacterium]|nr:hypothetical protein [Alphaproteobacteria bacterium]